MKFYVNEACMACGMCEGICPDVFHMTDDCFAKAIDEDVAPELEGAALEAKESCPAAAIEIV
ncbi:MAG TPA: 4Fe-4S ferredoxin [Clostridiales bacterium]|nr:4Fe-4S ferredoxin [Clostridiales bacterium]